MNKTPLKQADGTLVSGAYRAASAGNRQPDGFSQGMDKLAQIGQSMVDQAVDTAQEAQKTGDDLAKKILDTGGGLGTSWLNVVQGDVKGLHGSYKKAAKFGKKGKKAEGMQNLNTLSAEVASIKDLNSQIAEWQGPPGTPSDWSKSLKEKDQNIINAFMDNRSKKRSRMVNGQRVFEVETPEGFMSIQKIEEIANNAKKDYSTMQNIRGSVIEEVNKGVEHAFKNAQFGYVPPDEREKIKTRTIKNLKAGNLNSLMHDDILETGGSFLEDIIEMPQLKKMRYEDLGLTPPEGDDGIMNETLTKEHIQMIADNLAKPENKELALDLMGDYVLGFIDKNYTDAYESNGGSYQSAAGEESMSDQDIINAALKE
jgi:hypothetical protein